MPRSFSGLTVEAFSNECWFSAACCDCVDILAPDMWHSRLSRGFSVMFLYTRYTVRVHGEKVSASIGRSGMFLLKSCVSLYLALFAVGQATQADACAVSMPPRVLVFVLALIEPSPLSEGTFRPP